MEQRVERLEQKLDKVLEQQSEHNATLRVNTEHLKEHMKRSDALESIVLPMKRKWDMLEGALKLLGIMATITGVVVGAIKIVEFLMK